VTHQPNQSLNLDGDQDVLEGLFGKKNCHLKPCFVQDHPSQKKKELFALFFFKT
jgi:hypothetical protein